MSLNQNPPTDVSLVNPTVGLLNDQWVPTDQLVVGVNDLGFRQGVTAVERLRTYGGRVFESPQHLLRWQRTVDELGISGLPSAERIAVLVDELLQRNEQFVQLQRDVGITIVATPGSAGTSQSTWMVHLKTIDHAAVERRCRDGQSVVITNVVQPPAESWSRQIKVRSRIHYYRADQIAQRQSAGAMGLLVDTDGSVTESSVANIAIVQSGRIVSPPPDQILHGVTQSVIERLAATAGLSWRKEVISANQVRDADEVLLMGTDGGIWFANSVHSWDQAATAGRGLRAAPVYQRLRGDFDRHVISTAM
ncbi:MAG: aminotransferase class IV [Pirellulaceae bacterium]|nr:aminotransferase class IV [Pirellulaceae bacterium]